MADNTANTSVQPQTTSPASGSFNPNAAILQAQSPTGLVPIPAPGPAWAWFTPLKSTDAPISSGKLYYNGATAIAYQIVCDVPFNFKVNFYTKAGRKLSFSPNPVNYDPGIISSFQSSLNVKGDAIEFVITPIGDQSQLEFTADFSQGVQPTTSSSASMITDSNNAEVNKSTHQAKENGTGARKEITGTAVGGKFAQDVNITNPVDNSLLAKDSSLKDGTAKVQVTNLPTTQPVSGNFYPSTQPVSGTVAVSNLPNTQPISGSVLVSNTDYAKEITLTNGNQKTQVTNFPATQPVSGSISVSNLPTTQPVTGTVGINNFPTTQTVGGTVNIGNLPVTQPVSGSVNVGNFPASQAITGSVTVSNFPANTEITNDVGNPIPVIGNVALTNASIPVTGTFFQATQPVSGIITANIGTGNLAGITNSVTVKADTIANQTNALKVDGSAVTQPVSGSVSVSNFPSTQPISAASLPLPTGAATEASVQLLLTQLQQLNQDQGAQSDTQATNSTGNWSEIALLKGINSRPANTTVTPVTTLATQTNILAANANRKGATLYAAGTIYISLGATCSATVFTTRLVTNTYYEVPFGYTGIITSFGLATTINVTELT